MAPRRPVISAPLGKPAAAPNPSCPVDSSDNEILPGLTVSVGTIPLPASPLRGFSAPGAATVFRAAPWFANRRRRRGRQRRRRTPMRPCAGQPAERIAQQRQPGGQKNRQHRQGEEEVARHDDQELRRRRGLRWLQGSCGDAIRGEDRGKVPQHAHREKRPGKLKTSRNNVRRPQAPEDGCQREIDGKHDQRHGQQGKVLAEQDAAARGGQEHQRETRRGRSRSG